MEIWDWLRPQAKDGDAKSREGSLREQLQAFEQEALAFHQTIGLLRASLSLTSKAEQQQASVEEAMLPLHRPPDATEALALAVTLAQRQTQASRQHHLLHLQALRMLYQQVVELKQRYIRSQERLLRVLILELPSERQGILLAILEHILQGTQIVGVDREEARWMGELQALSQAPARTSTSPSSPPFGASQADLFAAVASQDDLALLLSSILALLEPHKKTPEEPESSARTNASKTEARQA